MKIVSWNINGIRAVHKKGFMEYLTAEDPDIIGLQEVRAQPDQIEPAQRDVPGYHCYYFPCEVKKGYSGVAMYSKEQPKKVVQGFGIARFDEEGRVIQADFGELRVMSVYFPNGGRGADRVQYKLEFYDALFAYANELLLMGKKLLIFGDYNTAHKEIDLARPRENKQTSGFLIEEREKLDQILSMGYVDTFREFNKEPNHYTWWDQKSRGRDRNVGWRIDYHFVSENLMGDVIKSYHRPDVLGSDHCPVVIELKD